jgi:cytochrome bd-type quinol oxidase subunit 2
MQTKKSPLSLGIAAFALAVVMGVASFSNIKGEAIQASGIDIQVGDFGLSTGSSGNVSGGTTAPGENSGGLTVPDGSAYKNIGQVGDFRQSLLNWTNFFLGFLAIVAMIILIYSGFLYVTAAGNQEQADKAKKTIIWVATGIIVILLAYSAVNTLINKGATGSDANLLRILQFN